MGLDTTHDCWHGAYSAFHRWRCAISEAAGMPVGLFDSASIGNGGSWVEVERQLPSGPIGDLLRHSDCDGAIPAQDCKPMALALVDLLPKLSGDGGGHLGDVREATVRVIAGLLRAHAAGEDVEFH